MSRFSGLEHATYQANTYAGNETYWDLLASTVEELICSAIDARDLESDSEITRTIYLKAPRHSIIILDRYPLQLVTTLEVNGEVIDAADFDVYFWYVYCHTALPRFSTVEMEYKVGFESSGVVPTKLAEAVYLTGVEVKNNSHLGGKLGGQTLGDWSESYQASDVPLDSMLSPVVRSILERHFVRPTF